MRHVWTVVGLFTLSSPLSPVLAAELGDIDADDRVSMSDAYRLWRWLGTGIEEFAPAPGSTDFEPEVRCTHQLKDLTAFALFEGLRRAALNSGREPLPHFIERWPAPSVDGAGPPESDSAFRLEILPAVHASGEGTAALRVRLDTPFPVEFVGFALEVEGLDVRPPHPIDFDEIGSSLDPLILRTSTEYYLISRGLLAWHTDVLRASPGSLPKFTLEPGTHEFSLPIALPRGIEPAEYAVRFLPGSELVTSFGETVVPELVDGSLQVTERLRDGQGHVQAFPPLRFDEEARRIEGRAELRFTEAEGFPGDVVTVRAQLRTERPINKLELWFSYDYRAFERVGDDPLYRDAASGEIEAFDQPLVNTGPSGTPRLDQPPSIIYQYYPFTFLNPEELVDWQLGVARTFSVYTNSRHAPPSLEYLEPLEEWIDLFELRLRIRDSAAGLGEAPLALIANLSEGATYVPYPDRKGASVGCEFDLPEWWTYEPLAAQPGRVRILGGGEPPVFDPPVDPEVARIKFTAGDRDVENDPIELVTRPGERIEVPLIVQTGTVLAMTRTVMSFDTSRLELLGFDAYFIDFDGVPFFQFIDASAPLPYPPGRSNTPRCFRCEPGLFPWLAMLHAGREELPDDAFIVDVFAEHIQDIYFQPGDIYFLGNIVFRVLDDAPSGLTEIPGARVTWRPIRALAPIESESAGMPNFEGQEVPVEPWIPAEVLAALVRIVGGEEPIFVRGDTDRNGHLEITDPVGLLASLFSDGRPLPCEDAADANDDGSLNVTDAVYSLTHLFSGGAAPPEPFPERGIDRTADELGCER